MAPLIANVRLNGKESAKDTRHIAFSIEGSGLSYEVGDALGVFPANCPDVVARVMESHRLDPEAVVPLPGGGEAPLRVALEHHYEVRTLVGKSAGDPGVRPPPSSTACAEFNRGSTASPAA